MHKTLSLFAFAICIAFSASAQKADTITTASGLKYYWLTKGNGPAIPAGYVAICDYNLTLTNGTKIDATADRGTPFATQIPSQHIIRGFNEALQLMHVGDRGVFILPYNIAYGEKGTGPIPPKATLVFDITLNDVKAKSLSMILDSVLFQKPLLNDSLPHTAAAIKTFKALKRDDFKTVYMNEGELNTVGYGLIQKFPKDAVEIFKLNVKRYPKSYNAYDSLAEGYMDAGDKKKAIKYYKKSLKLNPKNTNATDMLKKLGA